MHGSTLALAGSIAFAALSIYLFFQYRRRQRHERHRQRRMRQRAYQRAWDWIMRQNRLRISHRPSNGDHLG